MSDELNGNSSKISAGTGSIYGKNPHRYFTQHVHTHTQHTHIEMDYKLKNSLNLTFLENMFLSFGIYKHFLEKMQNLLNKKERKWIETSLKFLNIC